MKHLDVQRSNCFFIAHTIVLMNCQGVFISCVQSERARKQLRGHFIHFNVILYHEPAGRIVFIVSYSFVLRSMVCVWILKDIQNENYQRSGMNQFCLSSLFLIRVSTVILYDYRCTNEAKCIFKKPKPLSAFYERLVYSHNTHSFVYILVY